MYLLYLLNANRQLSGGAELEGDLSLPRTGSQNTVPSNVMSLCCACSCFSVFLYFLSLSCVLFSHLGWRGLTLGLVRVLVHIEAGNVPEAMNNILALFSLFDADTVRVILRRLLARGRNELFCAWSPLHCEDIQEGIDTC